MSGPSRFDAAAVSAAVGRWIAAPGAHDDKYSRGVVGLLTGSTRYPGAAVLSVAAAWRAGAGMVRCLTTAVRHPVLQARPETVFREGRCHAYVTGSGTDARTRSKADAAQMRQWCRGTAPVVVDAGALDLAPELCSVATAPVLLTPHWAEFQRLWVACGLPRTRLDAATREGVAGPTSAPATEHTSALVLELSAATGATVLLKGSETCVASPSGKQLTIGPNSPLLATAGSGDVLAGLLGALLAQAAARQTLDSDHSAEIAALGVWLHSRAAECAAANPAFAASGGAAQPGSQRRFTVTALDIVEALPYACAAAHAGSSG